MPHLPQKCINFKLLDLKKAIGLQNFMVISEDGQITNSFIKKLQKAFLTSYHMYDLLMSVMMYWHGVNFEDTITSSQTGAPRGAVLFDWLHVYRVVTWNVISYFYRTNHSFKSIVIGKTGRTGERPPNNKWNSTG